MIPISRKHGRGGWRERGSDGRPWLRGIDVPSEIGAHPLLHRCCPRWVRHPGDRFRRAGATGRLGCDQGRSGAGACHGFDRDDRGRGGCATGLAARSRSSGASWRSVRRPPRPRWCRTLSRLPPCGSWPVSGALPNVAAFVAEFAPARLRSLAVSITIVCVPVGVSSVAYSPPPCPCWWAWCLRCFYRNRRSFLKSGVASG